MARLCRRQTEVQWPAACWPPPWHAHLVSAALVQAPARPFNRTQQPLHSQRALLLVAARRLRLAKEEVEHSGGRQRRPAAAATGGSRRRLTGRCCGALEAFVVARSLNGGARGACKRQRGVHRRQAHRQGCCRSGKPQILNDTPMREAMLRAIGCNADWRALQLPPLPAAARSTPCSTPACCIAFTTYLSDAMSASCIRDTFTKFNTMQAAVGRPLHATQAAARGSLGACRSHRFSTVLAQVL